VVRQAVDLNVNGFAIGIGIVGYYWDFAKDFGYARRSFGLTMSSPWLWTYL
jgi:hypothetical protein